MSDVWNSNHYARLFNMPRRKNTVPQYYPTVWERKKYLSFRTKCSAADVPNSYSYFSYFSCRRCSELIQLLQPSCRHASIGKKVTRRRVVCYNTFFLILFFKISPYVVRRCLSWALFRYSRHTQTRSTRTWSPFSYVTLYRRGSFNAWWFFARLLAAFSL